VGFQGWAKAQRLERDGEADKETDLREQGSMFWDVAKAVIRGDCQHYLLATLEKEEGLQSTASYFKNQKRKKSTLNPK
jgi:hypothetical protein